MVYVHLAFKNFPGPWKPRQIHLFSLSNVSQPTNRQNATTTLTWTVCMCFVFQYAYSGQRVGASTTCRNRHCWISTSRSVRIATGFPEGDAKKKAATVITAEWNRDVQRNSSSPSYDRARSIATDSENLKKVSQFSFVSSPTAANTPRPSQHKKKQIKSRTKERQKKTATRVSRERLVRSQGREQSDYLHDSR